MSITQASDITNGPLLVKSLEQPDETRSAAGKGDVELVRLADVTVARATFQPGWRWTEHVKPAAGTELCEAAHIGYVVSGRQAVRMADGTQVELGPGDAFVVGPGHDSWVIGDEPCVTVDFSGGESFAYGSDAINGSAAATGYTVKTIDDMQSILHGAVKLAAAELGVESFGMQVLDLPPAFAEYPEHDHVDDGQEEVYVVLAGSAQFEIDGERVPVEAGQMVRIEAASRRKLWPGADGVRVLAIGCAPARRYERPEDFRLGAQS
jgi:mannose-6-phosphate isomerase-like protein (cupin superfamily)